MAAEDYKINGVNISVLANKKKQENGLNNLITAKSKLKEYSIRFEEGVQYIKFDLNNIKFTYWSKKNRVYNGRENTNLTLNKFIKENIKYFIKKDKLEEDVFYFGKYINKTIDKILEEDINYINWLLEKFKPLNEKDKNFITLVKIKLEKEL